MRTSVLYSLPFPSTALERNAQLLFAYGDVRLLYSYFDIDKEDKIFKSGIIFQLVQGHRHLTEPYAPFLCDDVYDQVIRFHDSDWVRQLKKDYRGSLVWPFELNHYAIFLDSNGLFEFCASGFKVLPITEGTIDTASYERID